MAISYDVDSQLDKVGGWGRYQKRYLMAYLAIPWLVSGMQAALQMVGARPNGFTCEQNAEIDSYLLSMFPQRNLSCDIGTHALTIGASAFSVQLFGLLLLGYLSNNKGRRVALFLSAACATIGAFGATFATGNFAVYVISSMITQFGLGGMQLSSFLWGSEILGIYNRANILLTTAISYGIGILIVFLLSLWTSNYRDLSLITACSGLPFFVLIKCLDESPRLYALKTHIFQAQGLIKRIAKVNGLSEQELAQIDDGSEFIGDGWTKHRKSAEHDFQNSYRDLFIDSRLRRRTFVMILSSMSISMAFFLLQKISTDPSSYDERIKYAIIAEVCAFTMLVLCLRCTQVCIKNSIVAALVLGGLCCISSAFVTGGSASELLIAFAGKLFLGVGLCMLWLYAVELFPTDSRSTCLAIIAALTTRSAAIYTPLIAKFTISDVNSPQVISGVLCLICACVIKRFLPITKHARLLCTKEDVDMANLAGPEGHVRLENDAPETADGDACPISNQGRSAQAKEKKAASSGGQKFKNMLMKRHYSQGANIRKGLSRIVAMTHAHGKARKAHHGGQGKHGTGGASGRNRSTSRHKAGFQLPGEFQGEFSPVSGLLSGEERKSAADAGEVGSNV